MNKTAYNVKYNKEHTTLIGIRLNNKTDADIISFMSDIPAGEKQGFIKKLLRSYIEWFNSGEWSDSEV